MKSLACFHTNAEDNLLTIKDDVIIKFGKSSYIKSNFMIIFSVKGADSDEEDFNIRSDDNLLLAGHFDEDVCSLNVYG